MEPALREALESDVALLFTPAPTASIGLKEFAARWRHLDFSLVHYCCQEADLRSNFMDLLYSLLAGYFPRFPVHCTFALYLAYCSQPEGFCAKFPIPVTIQMLRQFIHLSKNKDVMEVLERLLQADAFVVVMQGSFDEHDSKATACPQGRVQVDKECALELRRASEHLARPILAEDLHEIEGELHERVYAILEE